MALSEEAEPKWCLENALRGWREWRAQGLGAVSCPGGDLGHSHRTTFL